MDQERMKPIVDLKFENWKFVQIAAERSVFQISNSPISNYKWVVRIIAGQFRSRSLKSLPGMDTRPTSDKLRETLFNVLTAGNPDALAGTVWLDVFAGTGAVGIEALSRGAHSVYFVESSAKAAGVIRANLKSLEVGEGFEVIEREAVRALRLLDSEAIRADYIFLDPPYRMHEAYEEVLGFLSQSRMLHPQSLVIAEHDKRFDLAETFGALVRARVLKQGDANLSFYKLT
jgi:16S rRNA (guanine966-N2)-methyltransferase